MARKKREFINLKRASKKKIAKERNRVYQLRYRLRKKLDVTESAGERRKIRNQIIRTSEFLDSARNKLGKSIKPVRTPYKRIPEVIDSPQGAWIVTSVYKWDAHKVIDILLNEEYFEKYIIDETEFKKRESEDILWEVDELETKADMLNIYHLILSQNHDRKITKLELP